MTRWTEEQKLKALALAEVATIREAAEQTGIPAGTIKRWRFEIRTERGEPSEPNRASKTVERLGQQAAQEAVEEARDYIVERLKGLADGLYALAEEGLAAVREFMRGDPDKGGPEPDRDSAAWLRALVGAMHYGIQDAQLLSGKPTARPEVVNRHEYDVTQRIIAERPELLDAVFAEDQQHRLAHRCRQGPPAGLG